MITNNKNDLYFYGILYTTNIEHWYVHKDRCWISFTPGNGMGSVVPVILMMRQLMDYDSLIRS